MGSADVRLNVSHSIHRDAGHEGPDDSAMSSGLFARLGRAVTTREPALAYHVSRVLVSVCLMVASLAVGVATHVTGA